MQVITSEKSRVPIKAWIDGVEFEEQAKQQALNVTSLPFVYKHVALMPDVHWGNGCCVGAVIATKGAIIPATVGVDLFCGVIAAKLPIKADELTNLSAIRSEIEQAVPHGRTNHGGPNDKGAWPWDSPRIIGTYWTQLEPQLKVIIDEFPKIDTRNARKHLGTLGTGNHFISINYDQNNDIWLMLHSGSRGIGNQLGSCFIELAKKDMRKYFINLPDENLAYLVEGTDYFNWYVKALEFAAAYAEINRHLMLRFSIDALFKALKIDKRYEDLSFTEVINTHHNYIVKENHFRQNVWVTRKGAVRARLGDLSVVPGTMAGKSFIIKGKGNPESFMSCSHGAGRRMSRNQARKTISLEDHIKATEGVECRKDIEVLDESVNAYKDVNLVMEAQKDLIDIVYTLQEIVNIKG